ncbi:MAG: nucleotidyltransferase [Chitinispirillaceae bacterium]|nr:nucleotidyltransferase [Chitinispirillaceae bacterium]
MNISKDMIDFIRLLKKHKIPFTLVGGFAVIYYGYPRLTQDIDILIDPSPRNAKKMILVLEEFGFGGVGFSEKLFQGKGTAVHLGVEPNRIDILTSLKGVSNAVIFSRLKKVRLQGIVIPVISLSDLIRCKKNSKRLKDLADAEALENSIQRGRGRCPSPRKRNYTDNPRR